MDFSTIRLLIDGEYAVDENGNPTEQLTGTRAYACQEHGTTLSSWESARIHVEAQHSGDTVEEILGHGVPTDATNVSTSHAVELETPDDE